VACGSEPLVLVLMVLMVLLLLLVVLLLPDVAAPWLMSWVVSALQAVGLLDQIAHSEDAVDLLTCTPTRRESGKRPESVSGRVAKMWPGSVRAAPVERTAHAESEGIM
jgi:hypothetical protein